MYYTYKHQQLNLSNQQSNNVNRRQINFENFIRIVKADAINEKSRDNFKTDTGNNIYCLK